jgi:hyperosmotically inducible protein
MLFMKEICMYSNALTLCVLTGALALGPGAASVTYAQANSTASTATSDSTLHDRIHEAIEKDATLKNQDIDVDVTNHVVTLTGTVQTASRKSRAERIAKVAGISRVDNQLRIDPNAGKNIAEKTGEATKSAAKTTGHAVGTAGEKTKDAAVATGEKTKDVAVAAGEKTKDAAVATGDNITDGYITTSLHAKFVDEATLKGSDISVDTNNHVVTLKGTVVSAAGKARAEEIARTTKGVNRVINQIVIGPKK